MVNGADQLDRMRRSRMSLVILAISLAGIYYSTQTALEYKAFLWVNVMAGVSVILFAFGLYMSYVDWKGEIDLRKRLEELWEAQTSHLRGQERFEDLDEEPANKAKESGVLPEVNWGEIINK